MTRFKQPAEKRLFANRKLLGMALRCGMVINEPKLKRTFFRVYILLFTIYSAPTGKHTAKLHCTAWSITRFPWVDCGNANTFMLHQWENVLNVDQSRPSRLAITQKITPGRATKEDENSSSSSSVGKTRKGLGHFKRQMRSVERRLQWLPSYGNSETRLAIYCGVQDFVTFVLLNNTNPRIVLLLHYRLGSPIHNNMRTKKLMFFTRESRHHHGGGVQFSKT